MYQYREGALYSGVGAPADRTWRPAVELPNRLRGQRLALNIDMSHEYVIATDNATLGADGRLYVNVVTERAWHRQDIEELRPEAVALWTPEGGIWVWVEVTA